MEVMKLPWIMILSHSNYELYKHIQSEQSWFDNIFTQVSDLDFEVEFIA